MKAKISLPKEWADRRGCVKGYNDRKDLQALKFHLEPLLTSSTLMLYPFTVCRRIEFLSHSRLRLQLQR
jgi:hypothetical protein